MLTAGYDHITGAIGGAIATHAGDIVKGVKSTEQWDRKISVARKKLNWEEHARLSLDSEQSRQVHSKHVPSGSACSMCGEFCAMALVKEYLGVLATKY